MATTKPLSEAVKARIKELAAAGWSRNAIARELGISNGSVTRHAPKDAFDRQPTAAATQAKQADNRERRAVLVDLMLSQAERTLRRIQAPTYTHRVKVADSTFVVTDQQVDSEDERNHLTGVAALMASVARLEALDTDTGAQAARSMLKALGDALGVAGPDS